MVALSNKAHLSGADFRGPRVDWRDLAEHSRGELICLTGAPLVGVLSPQIEHAADPGNPVEAVALTRRLAKLYPHLYLELASRMTSEPLSGLAQVLAELDYAIANLQDLRRYHHQPREKLINRGLVALAQRWS